MTYFKVILLFKCTITIYITTLISSRFKTNDAVFLNYRKAALKLYNSVLYEDCACIDYCYFHIQCGTSCQKHTQ